MTGRAVSTDDTDRTWARDVTIGALAVWRVSHLLALEDGPADVVATARARVGDTVVGELMDCFACLSVWVAAAAAPLVARRRRDLPMTWLALSGAACLLERLGSRGEPVIDVSTLVEGEGDDLLRAGAGRDGE